jgi:sulfatase modifying factor 1
MKKPDGPNFEAKSSYSVRVRSTDQGGLFTEKSFTVTVTDVNESPTLVSAVRLSRIAGEGYARLAQDQFLLQAGVQYRFTARYPTNFTPTPPDNIPEYWGNGVAVQTTSESVSYRDGWTYYEAISTPQSTGTYELVLALWSDSLDVTDISVRPVAGGGEMVRNGSFTDGLRQWYTIGGQVQLVDVPLLSTAVSSLPESTSTLSRVKVADVRFVDDGTGTNAVSLTGADASSFEVDGTSVYLKAGVLLDREAKPSYSITISVSDSSITGGQSLTATFLLSVTNVNETPTDIALSSSSIAENAGANAVAGTLSTTDPDASNTFTYTLVSGTGSTDNASFNISGNQLRATASLNFEAKNSYSVRVRATDQSGLFTEKAFTVLVSDFVVAVDMVTVGNPGNANDATGYGAVNYSYQIGKVEITIGQYAEFLNAVAKSDPYSLYDPNMGTSLSTAGISRSGQSGSYDYIVMSNSGNKPIAYIDWFDAARFANWMHNGQDMDGTETGAYTLLNGQTYGTAPARNPGARFYIPTENEWYKAAYYSPLLNSGSGGYWTYATQSDTAPGNSNGSGGNLANYYNGVYSVTQSASYSSSQNYLTDVGAYTLSASFYGTFDQSGNVCEWNDLTAGTGAATGEAASPTPAQGSCRRSLATNKQLGSQMSLACGVSVSRARFPTKRRPISLYLETLSLRTPGLTPSSACSLPPTPTQKTRSPIRSS